MMNWIYRQCLFLMAEVLQIVRLGREEGPNSFTLIFI